ncbi:MAG: ISNCY family transposase [Verrucomicrobia bacterium]|nr:ISNCY family transposase [Verrucomicrobiota bacterium]
MITLSERDQQRLSALVALKAGQISPSEAASALGMSVRQLRRVRERFDDEGVAGLPHRGRCKRPANACPPELAGQVTSLYRERYPGTNQEQFTEFLLERHGIDLSRSTVRRYLALEGIGAPMPQKRSRHRRRRVRRAQEGALIQMDGSTHDWLEGRGQHLTLIGGIDDATNKVWARFYTSEQMNGYFEVIRTIVEENGIPAAIYTDRTALMLSERRTEKQEKYLSHLSKALQRMGVALIQARSPQAKGRIERLWRTMQDRLVSELRAIDVKTLEGANRALAIYLRRHNMRFRKEAFNPDPAWRPWDLALGVEDTLCWVFPRVVRLDNTVTINNQVLQLEPGADGASWARKRVSVHQRPDGSLTVLHQTTSIPHRLYSATSEAESAA